MPNGETPLVATGTVAVPHFYPGSILDP
jgi:hypothetical protein